MDAAVNRSGVAAPARRELLLGGQRSGKSRRAEQHAADWLAQGPGFDAVLLATATPGDAEMQARIARHQQDRAQRVPRLRCAEVGADLAAALRAHAAPHRLVLVDCLTLWLSGLCFPLAGAGASAEGEKLEQNSQFRHIEQDFVAPFLGALAAAPGPVVLVGNEIGLGVIPLGAPVRAFVDALGWLNQACAARCERVTLMVAGLPLVLKGAA